MRKRITNEEFMESLKNVFGDEYDLSEVNYINSQTKVDLICKKHGKFSALPHNLLAHKGCPKCRYEKSSYKNRCKLEDVIEKCNEKHNFKYDYSLVTEYKNNRIKYPIICHEKDTNGKEHGVFYQSFDNHLNRGNGCPKCSGNNRRTKESIIEDANKVHNNKYDYSKVEYNGIHEKMCIICHEKDENGIEHGEFWQAPNDHLHGQGCPKCALKKVWDKRGRLTVNEVKEQFKKVHGDKYDYSLFTDYKNNRTKIPIICKTHGVFYVTPNNHLMNRGCPECKIQKVSEKQRLPINEVIKRIKNVHGDKFIIPEDFEYKNNQDKVKLICKKHGEFWQNPFNLWKGHGCPKCANLVSQPELDIIEYISTFLPSEWIIHGDRTILNGKELDIYIPKLHVAIEYNGLRWHSEEFNKDKNYHLNKLKECNEKGIKLIQIFEDEWLERKEIVLKKIKHILGFNNGEKVYARKCEVKEIDKHKAYEFLEKNHIQGSVDSTVAFGALYKSEIVAVMLLTQESDGYWNLTRFASDNDKRCIGIASSRSCRACHVLCRWTT